MPNKKILDKRSLLTVAIALLLVGSLLPMLFTPAEGSETLQQADEDDFVEVDFPDDIGNYYVGQDGIEIPNGVEVDALEQDDNQNITQVWVEMDPENKLVEEGVLTWENQKEVPADSGANMTLDENDTYAFGTGPGDDWYDPEPFEFNINRDAELGEYHIEVRVYYTHANEAGDIQNTYLDAESRITFEINSPLIEYDTLEDEYYIGQQEETFEIGLTNIDDDLTEVWVEVDTTDYLVFEEYQKEIGDLDAGDSDEVEFEFDVLGDATPGEYEMEITVHFEYVENGGEGEISESIEFEILQNADVRLEMDPTELWAGENFQGFLIELENEGGEQLTDIELELIPPAGIGITLHDPVTEISELDDGETIEIEHRADVDHDVEPGFYTFEYELEAARDGVDIEEDGEIEEDLVVEFTPRITVEEEEISVDKGVTQYTVEVTFKNTGNVPLRDVYVGMITDDDYFIKAVDHYEYGDEVKEPAVLLGDLDVEEEEQMEFTIGLHRYLQEGRHKLRFRWDGWFYNDGSTGDPISYEHIGVDWDNGDPFYYEVVEEDEYDHEYEEEVADELEEWPRVGPYTFLNVSAVDYHITGTVEDDIELEGDIKNIGLDVTLENHELVDFKDLLVELEVGEDTPFLNPTNRTKDYVEMDPTESVKVLEKFDIEEGEVGEATLVFYVNINTEYVENELLGEGASRYTANLIIRRAVNEDTNEEINDIPVEIEGEARGLGPRLVVEGDLEENQIVEGERFNLTYTISNHGDDTARDVWIEMQPELYDNENWDVLHGFIWAISSTEREREGPEWEMDLVRYLERKNVSEEVTLEQLGIDDAEEIADLHMYFKNALSAPRPHTWRMYVSEIAPGDEVSVSFNMVSSEDMHLGQPYQENITIDFIDSYGIEYENQEYPTTIGPMHVGEVEEVEEPAEVFGMDAAMFGVILVIIILVIVLAVSLASRKTGGKEEEEETFEELEEEPEIEEEFEEEPLEPDETEEDFEEIEEELEEEEE